MSNLIIPRKVFKTKYEFSSINEMLAKFPAVGGVITLPSAVYYIDSADFDFTGYTLTHTEPIALGGYNQFISTIKTDSIGVNLIESRANIYLFNLRIQAEGAGTKAINFIGTGVEAIDLNTVEFVGNTAWGDLVDIRQAFMSSSFAIGSERGFLLKGTWTGGFTLFDTRFINVNSYVLKGDVGFTCSSIRSNVNADVDTGSVIFDFDYDMFVDDEAYQLEGCKVKGNGLFVSQFTDAGRDTDDAWKSRKSFFNGNKGSLSKNTRIGGYWSCTAESTTALTLNNIAKLAGTTTYDFMQHIASSGDNALVQNTTNEGSYIIDGNIIIDGDTNDDITLTIRKYDDSAATYVLVAEFTRRISGVQGPLDVAIFRPYVPLVMLDEKDRIEIWVTNISDSSDVTMLEGSNLSLKAT